MKLKYSKKGYFKIFSTKISKKDIDGEFVFYI